MILTAETLANRIEECVHLLDIGSLMVRFDPTEDMPLGLLVHHGKRDDTVARLVKQAAPDQKQGKRIAIFHRDRVADARALRLEIAVSLERVARLPIGMRHVERLMGITSTERTRWSKDGRLPVSGSAIISKGPNKIAIPTYSPVRLERLMGTPDIVLTWRAADAAETPLAAPGD